MAPSANALLIGTITDGNGRQQSLFACQEKGRWRLRLEDPGAEDRILHDVGISAGTLKALTQKTVRAYSDMEWALAQGRRSLSLAIGPQLSRSPF